MAKPKPKPQKVGIDSVKGRNNTPILLGIGGVVVALLAIALLISALGGDKKSGTQDAVEFQPVTITGEPLPPQYSDAQGQVLNEAKGAQAPSLNGKGFDGTEISITADGKPKVIVFYAHWCPHCQREVPVLSEWIKDNATKYPKVSFYGVATGSNPTRPNYPPSAWLEKEKWPTPIMVDDNKFSAADSYGLGSYPYIVALDGQNKVVTRTSGELSTTDFETKVVQPANATATS